LSIWLRANWQHRRKKDICTRYTYMCVCERERERAWHQSFVVVAGEEEGGVRVWDCVASCQNTGAIWMHELNTHTHTHTHTHMYIHTHSHTHTHTHRYTCIQCLGVYVCACVRYPSSIPRTPMLAHAPRASTKHETIREHACRE
jgi:hypothetical protein